MQKIKNLGRIFQLPVACLSKNRRIENKNTMIHDTGRAHPENAVPENGMIPVFLQEPHEV
jgi:hypothetical protein